MTIERAIDNAGRRPQPKRSWLRFMQGTLSRHAILVAILAVGFACGSPSDTEPSAETGDVDWADGVGAPSVRVLVVKGEEVEETWIPAVGTAIPDEVRCELHPHAGQELHGRGMPFAHGC